MNKRKTSAHRCNHPVTRAAAAALLVLGAQSAVADVVVWKGGNGNWMSDSSWSTGVAPNAATAQVSIDNLTSPGAMPWVRLNQSVAVDSLSVGQSQGLRVDGGGNVVLYGDHLTNHGRVELIGGSSQDRGLSLLKNTLLTGLGVTVLGRSSQGYEGYITGSGKTLTIGPGHTLRGSGHLGEGDFGVFNRGLVIAEGGKLNINVGWSHTFDNTDALVQVAGDGVLSVSSGLLVGGTVQSLGAGAQLSGGTFSNLVLQGDFRVHPNGVHLRDTTVQGQVSAVQSTLSLNGRINVLGELQVAASSRDAAYLSLDGATLLAGAGVTRLVRNASGYAPQIQGYGQALTIGADHTLRGAGQIGDGNLFLVNTGRLIAEGGELALTVGLNGTVNNSQGLMQIAADGSLWSGQATVKGGVVQSLGTGARLNGAFQNVSLQGDLQTSYAVLTDSRIDGRLTAAGGSVVLSNRLDVNGELNIMGNSSYGSSGVLVTDTTLAGPGTTRLASYSNSLRSFMRGDHTLTIAADHTLRGNGSLGASDMAVVNQGTVIAEGGELTLYLNGSQSFDNSHGMLRIDDTGTVNRRGGDLLLGDASTLWFDVQGFAGKEQHGVLRLDGGSLRLDGKLHLEFAEFVPAIGQSFALIDTAGTFSGNGSFSGAFDAITSNGYTLSLSIDKRWLTATVTGVAAAVPEPSTWALTLIGGLAVVGWARRRSPAQASA